MRYRNVSSSLRLIVIVVALALVAPYVAALAQNTSQSGSTSTQSGQQSSGSSSQTSTTTQSQPSTTTGSTTTTTQSQPAQTTTQTSQATGVDPMWLIIGAVALLAILLIAILSMRGRSRDGDTVVREKTTVKRD